ncbi:MAG: gamma-glutamyltransferase [Rhizobiales bacterium]|nr:gamma-glutamyltransferase [Hyphomicrobiales bacterium]
MRDLQLPGRSAAYGMNGMAATSSPLATLAAVDVLRAGGNAVDAAVTASAVLCMTEPHMTGIGGDCFVLLGFPDGKVVGLNGSGRAAMAADADWLKSSRLTEIGFQSVHSVTVPGAIDAWDRLLKRYGSMSLGDALAPAIRLGEEGVPITPRVAFDWTFEVEMLSRDPGGRQHYLRDGQAPKTGDVMHYPALAATFKTLAKEGRDAFYAGAIVADMIGELRQRGSLLTPEDFARTEATWVEPIATSFAGHEILEIPPNGQGITALIALNILSRFDLARYAPESVERRHLEIEAIKLAWVYRNRYIADPGQVAVPVAEMLSSTTADRLASLIDMNQAIEDPALKVALPRSDTVYLTVVDKDGLAVSFINSIYASFGSGIVTGKTGIALQNRGCNFVTTPGHPNCIGPGKRPLHTIIPAMVRKDGRIAMSYGVMGGAYQPMGHVAVALNRYVHGMDPQEAIDFPRCFPDFGQVEMEHTIPAVVAAGLAAKGHKLTKAVEPLGGGQAIEIRPNGMLIGGSDPRKDGCALGF